MKTYIGTVGVNRKSIIVRKPACNGLPLNARLDLRDHSPDGFAWGYGGSGPAQTALALLADTTGSDVTALRYYQRFKRDVIANLATDRGWEMSEEWLHTLLTAYRADEEFAPALVHVKGLQR